MSQADTNTRTNAAASVVRWLAEGALTASRSEEVLQQLCDQLVEAGLPLVRAAVFVRTLHPDIVGRRFLWQRGQSVQIDVVSYQDVAEQGYADSLLVRVGDLASRIRLRADTPAGTGMEIYRDRLIRQGGTDYIVDPLRFTTGDIHAVGWTTDTAGGFSQAQASVLTDVREPLARMAEIYANRRTAANFLNTYVGVSTGERVLKGQIRRGDVDEIDAVILMADLRRFTTIADSLDGDTLLNLLNGFFDCLVPPIFEQGGEVLKYIGDGLLAIFPIDDERSAARACDAALAAAIATQNAVEVYNAKAAANGRLTIGFGLSLHVGTVLYGNIGAADRLDFTAIGPAVNLAARLEPLSRTLNRDLVFSAEFARHCSTKLTSLGAFELKGLAEPQDVFGLDGA